MKVRARCHHKVLMLSVEARRLDCISPGHLYANVLPPSSGVIVPPCPHSSVDGAGVRAGPLGL